MATNLLRILPIPWLYLEGEQVKMMSEAGYWIKESTGKIIPASKEKRLI